MPSCSTALAEYGPEVAPLRQGLRETIGSMADSIWHPNPRAGLQSRAIQIATGFAQTRLLLFAQSADAILTPFLMVLVLWLALIFTSFSIFAPANGTVATVLFVCIPSASSAIFLILEVGSPFQGLMQISSEPLRNALGPVAELHR